MKVVLHFHLLELLSITEEGVKGRMIRLVTRWIVGPRSNQGRKEGMEKPYLRRRTQDVRVLVGVSIVPVWML